MSWVEENPNHQVGIRIFDELESCQKLAMLEQIGRSLLVKDVSSPVQTAVSEGTIAAVYNQLLMDLELECHDKEGNLRQLVDQACMECSLTDGPSESCSLDMNSWTEAIEALMFRILWDSDWEGEYVKPDEPPEDIGALRASMGIDDDYYAAVAPDPNLAQLVTIRASLWQLCGQSDAPIRGNR